MSGGSGTPRPGAPTNGGASSGLCVLLACFAGLKQAAKIRSQLDKRINSGGDTVLDQVVLKVNAKHKAQVYDPHRTLAGWLTPALTWGIFGLLAGGLQGLAVWAVVGAVCGGLYAYYFEHLATKDERKRIGARLPGDSSAILAFARGPDARRVLSSTATFEPVTASVAAVAADLSAQVYTGAAQPVESSATSATEAGAAPTAAADQTAELSMVMLRFPGEHAAQQALAKSDSAKHQDHSAPQVELVVETNEHGRRRVVDPTTGTVAFAKSATISWGAFGVVYGAIVGFTSNAGVLSSLEKGLVVGILWAIFGLVAGALYGMWAGRGVSARRLKGLEPLLPPGTSLLLAWAEGSVTQQALERWTAPESQQLIVRFSAIGHGAVLEV